MSICSLFLLLAAAIYGWGALLARYSPDYRDQQQSPDDLHPPETSNDQDSEESAHLPLLNEPGNASQTQSEA